MTPRLETLIKKKLIGKRLTMTFAENKTVDLWRSFMPRRHEIQNNIGSDLYSMQNYSEGFFNDFNPNRTFEKWATVEVTDFNFVPDGMEIFIIPSGLYAIFNYKGDAANALTTFQYILGEWLPNSGYKLDTRPHFEILGEKYKNGDANSEEEIWIPIVKVV